MGQSQLSPRTTVLMGLVFIAFGIFFILMGLGLITRDDAVPDTPAWLPVCFGLVFVAGGATIILTYGIAGVGPDGERLPGTPLSIRLTSLLLGTTMVGSLAAIMARAAYRSGPIDLTSTGATRVATRLVGASGRLLLGALPSWHSCM